MKHFRMFKAFLCIVPIILNNHSVKEIHVVSALETVRIGENLRDTNFL